MTFHAYASAAELFQALSDHIVAHLSEAVAVRGEASLVVPGGTTPSTLFDILCKREAPWPRITVTLSDERWVDPDSEESNERMVRHRLLREQVSLAQFVPWKTPDAHAREAEPAVNANLERIARPFDLVILGMGTDGHTASLIPDAECLPRALDTQSPRLVSAIPSSRLGERMTLTLRAILNARSIALLIRGEEKKAAFEAAGAGADILEMPIRGVLHQAQVPIAVWWSP